MKNRVVPCKPARARDPRAGTAFRATLLAAALAAAGSLGATETSILVSPNAAPAAEMAYAVGVDGTWIVVGAPGEDTITGAAYAIDCATLPCAMAVRIVPDDVQPDDAFGTAVGISGDTLVATAPGPEPGAAYIYVRDAGGWTQQARLTPGGGSSGERFGVSASLSGDRVAIGAERADNRAGAVYVFVRTGTNWIQEARLTAADAVPRDALGSSVSLDGDTLLAGAPVKDRPAGGSYANGAAYVFTRDAGGWAQQAKLLPSSGANGDLFGFAVDVAGDRAVIGAPYALSAQGTAYVFSRSGTAWSQQAQLDAATGAAGDEFGWSVALGDDRVVVGAPFAGQLIEAACGASYVFEGSTFVETGASAIAQPLLNELTGWSVAASGARWVVSAPGHVVGLSDHAGAAYWFDSTITIFRSGFELSEQALCVPAEGG
jgi:hypothetical protein